MAGRHDKPILLHPIRGADMPDYKSEDRSRYEIWWTFGWPYETSAAMARIVFSWMFDRFPDLKIVTHHLGAMVPYFEGRVGPGWDQLGARTSDEDLGAVLQRLNRRPLDYFKDFYADSAVFGSRAATVCGLEFFGPDRVLFASDSPFDPEKGRGYIRDTIKVLESLDLEPEAAPRSTTATPSGCLACRQADVPGDQLAACRSERSACKQDVRLPDLHPPRVHRAGTRISVVLRRVRLPLLSWSTSFLSGPRDAGERAAGMAHPSRPVACDMIAWQQPRPGRAGGMA